MSIIRKYKCKTVKVENPLPGIYSAWFSSLDHPFRYKPGQFLHLALDEYDPSMPWPDSRCFSMQSNPSETLLKITFSVKGNYTKRMADELSEGSIVYLKLPYGELFSRNYPNRPCVFIAGGTGITPFLSLFTDRTFSSYVEPKLYLGIRNEKYNLYTNEISAAKRMNNNFDFKIINENLDGMLDIDAIFKLNKADSVYYISGPLEMIKSFKEYLTKFVDSENVITDDWE